MIRPRQQAPELEVALVGGGTLSIDRQHPQRFSLVVFYRGLHCPVCRGYLGQLDDLLDELADVGVTSVVAVSGDDAERAARSVEQWQLERLQVGYGQSIESMREWGLFVSAGIKEEEPALFGEPGLFLVRPDGTLYAGVVNTMPFGRPHLDEIAAVLRWVNEHDYPARGEA
jgi:peroxiredoxin